MSRSARSSGTRADIVLLAVAGAVSLAALVLPNEVRDGWASGMRRSLVAPLVSLQSRAQLSREALLAHDSVTLAKDSVGLQLMAARALERENERLRRLLGLAQQLRWGFVPAEALRAQGAREDFMLTLTAGANAGVARYSPVVVPEGLVGMVQTVDPTLSLAISWSHPDFRVSAMTADGSAFGIVAAHLGGGAERYMLEMRGVPFRTSLQRGTLVMSSGLGGTYPRGIPIGVVQGELETAEGWARTYLIRPMVLPSDVSNVMILIPQRVNAGVANVWASAAALDSATRAVAAAGDSIAAADSSLARAARRADSVARAAAARPPVTPPVGGAAGTDTATRRATPPAAPVRRDTAARRPAPVRRDTTARPAPVRRDTAPRPAPVRRDTTPPAPRPADTTPPPPVPPATTGEPTR